MADSSRVRAARAPIRIVGTALLLAGLLVALVSSAAPAQEPSGQGPSGDSTGDPGVDILEVEGIVDHTVVRYLERALEDAERNGAEVIVVRLDTPGTLGIDAQRLADTIAASPVPVAVWIGPPGARAAYGGALLADSAHVLALSPAAVLGPVTAVDLGDRPEVADQPVSLVLPAGMDALPDGVEAPPGVELEALSVLSETATVRQGVADIVAPTLPDLLRELDGREVTVAGRSQILNVDPVAANVRFNNMSLFGRILHTAASPALAYLLIVGGMMAMLFELYQPGFGVAGLSGLAVFALGGYGLWVLPANWLALALLLAGMVLLAMDLSLGRLRTLTAAGTAALAAGSWWLLPGPEPLTLPGWLIAFVVVANLAYFVPILTTVLRAQGNQALAGAEGLVGRTGVVRSMLNPEGHVFVEGALWRAKASDEAGKVKTGTPVRVVGLDDRLTLEVELAEAPEREPSA